MTFRFAVLAGVSSDEQIKDAAEIERVKKNKTTEELTQESITQQITDCREFAERAGGIETHEPFIMNGYSRSFYEGLAEAMADIPPLADAIRAAEHNEYDVLFVRYFERLGTLAYPAFLRLARSYKKQLRSIQEATPIMPPEIYDITKDEITSMMIHVSSIKQDYRINRIVSNLRDNMPRRIKDGLTPGKIPYGYEWVSPKVPPVQVPEKVALLLTARRMLFEGASYQKIAQVMGLNFSAVPYVLSNVYYAGVVAYNKGYVQRQGNKEKRFANPREKWTTGEGKHEALWTMDEHEAIVAEIERRRQSLRHNAVRYQFSGLVRCDICNGYVRRAQSGSGKRRRRVVVCRDVGMAHCLYEYQDFFNLVTREIQRELERENTGEAAAEDADTSDVYRKAIAELQRKRRRVQEGYESDPPLYTMPEASRLLKTIDADLERNQKQLDDIITRRASRRTADSALRGIDWRHIPEWLREEEPGIVNRLLSAWLQEIRIRNGGIVKLVKR